MSKLVRIANGQGFWGDSIDAPVRLVEAGNIDYLTLDYLAEVTLSIMQKQRRKDPQLGYATDFVDLMKRTLPQLKAKGIRVVANAGGVNPEACRTAVLEVAKKLGVKGVKIATVTGDDVLGRLSEFKAQGLQLGNMDTGEGLFDAPRDILSANVYLQTQAMVEALDTGADIVLTGRCTDPGLTLAPLLHEFKWAADDWDRLAAGTVAGHILECGAQSTGGNFSRWWEVPELWNVGYPIAECSEDGTFVITKHAGTGGMVTVDTVSEQLVYEMGDPKNYITPDVVADFTSIQLGAGRPRPGAGPWREGQAPHAVPEGERGLPEGLQGHGPAGAERAPGPGEGPPLRRHRLEAPEGRGLRVRAHGCRVPGRQHGPRRHRPRSGRARRDRPPPQREGC